MEVSELALMIFKHDLNLLAQLNTHFNRLCGRVLRPSTELKIGRFHTKHDFYKVSDSVLSSKYPFYLVNQNKKKYFVYAHCDIKPICIYLRAGYTLMGLNENHQVRVLSRLFNDGTLTAKIGNLDFNRVPYCRKKKDSFKITVSDELVILSCSGICFISKNNGITSHLIDAIKGCF